MYVYTYTYLFDVLITQKSKWHSLNFVFIANTDKNMYNNINQ